MRINKYLACSGCCSRRAADELIAAGKVLINGMTACAGQKVEPGDEVSVNGELLSPLRKNVGSGRICIMLHKPVHVVSTASDPQRRRTVLDILPAGLCSERVYPVGRLDYFSEGLILLSNDGELTFRLTHPGWHVPRIYEVKIRDEVDTAALQTMRSGMTLAEGEKLAPVDAEVIKSMPGATLLRLTLHQGVNRQIRRMCRDLGLTILYLKRVQIGPLKLGDLPRGEARHLKKHELAALRKAVGLT
ncbi:MAG: rRNA pseudouridine synthase [Desulfovibrionaceae bacterium]|nr:rRNA pseudouridine synthase [Desulfovibrionaceae bacterium]